ncbi:hypothetical protein N7G274_005134 [Stereocaulon virgatum]|uniref:BZIP domain-containing protein n=1 Tax=Stereocaulon virgatum TaxID=373712 RepID=A0ABR4AAP1_9LECA
MPPTISYRPQTLKQAKKAYRKSSATVRLSESELAIIERRAVLQERADRIKEREARRKANVKRRDEKIQREREARQRMGIESPVKGGIHVGPSQLHLGEFMHMGVQRKRAEPHCENINLERKCTVATSLKDCQAPAITSRPSRKPLQVITTNVIKQQKDNAELEELRTQGQSRCTEITVATESPPPPPSQALPTALAAQRRRLAKTEDSKLDDKEPTRCETASMGPPPLPGRLQPQPSATTAQHKPPRSGLTYKPPDPVDDCWDDFFVSNTQIVRELSPPALNNISNTLHAALPSSKPPSTLSIPPKDDTASLLNLLSTQDLDTSDILTQSLYHAPQPSSPQPSSPQPAEPTTVLAQISTQDLDFSADLELTQISQTLPSPQNPSSDFTDDLTVSDLEDFALEIETSQQSMRESHKSQQFKEAAQLAAEAYDFGFEFSTQDLRELGS